MLGGYSNKVVANSKNWLKDLVFFASYSNYFLIDSSWLFTDTIFTITGMIKPFICNFKISTCLSNLHTCLNPYYVRDKCLKSGATCWLCIGMLWRRHTVCALISLRYLEKTRRKFNIHYIWHMIHGHGNYKCQRL